MFAEREKRTKGFECAPPLLSEMLLLFLCGGFKNYSKERKMRKMSARDKGGGRMPNLTNKMRKLDGEDTY